MPRARPQPTPMDPATAVPETAAREALLDCYRFLAELGRQRRAAALDGREAAEREREQEEREVQHG